MKKLSLLIVILGVTFFGHFDIGQAEEVGRVEQVEVPDYTSRTYRRPLSLRRNPKRDLQLGDE